MRLKGTLGAVIVMLSIGVFYSFAVFIVEDVGENEISYEYYYSAETAVTSEEPTDESTGTVREEPEAVPPAVTEAPVSEDLPDETEAPEIAEETSAEEASAQTEAAAAEETPVTEASAVTEAPAATEVPSETAPAEKPQTETEAAKPDGNDGALSNEDEDYPEDFDVDELSDGSSQAEEQTVFGADRNSGAADNSLSEQNVFADLPELTDIKVDVMVWEGFDSDPAPAETSVEVSVSHPDISTNETFTAKINGKVQTVNAYDLICKIVTNEMSPSFSDEALKAQAVAAYSYMKYHNVNGLTPTVLVKGDPPERIKKLVSEVWGVCCYYNGKVAQTVYMASSSGYTADAKNVWGGSVPYLKSVACPFDIGNDPNYGSTMTLSENTVRQKLENSLGITLSGDPSGWLVVTEYVDGNYVSKISVDGQKTVSGRKFREEILGYSLKSAAFDVYYSGGSFVFTTYGYGHGVGMSQNGANILAKQGYSYVDILKHYFTGIEVI